MNRIADIITHKPETISTNISRETVISGLEIPSKYFIDKRQYKPETLVAFDIGECYNPNKQMFNRAVVPVYDENHNYIGCVGRSLDDDNKKYKWVNSKGFKKSCYLYGLWIAKPYIEKTSTVILVEGQGDVWRLYEAGIKNSVGIFGADLSDDQLITLESLSIFNVVILTDTDEAGTKAANSIIQKCGRRFNYYRPKISTKDVGEMTIEQIESELKPQIKGLF
jgi:DNA primase